jgi:hypothetical protein
VDCKIGIWNDGYGLSILWKFMSLGVWVWVANLLKVSGAVVMVAGCVEVSRRVMYFYLVFLVKMSRGGHRFGRRLRRLIWSIN